MHVSAPVCWALSRGQESGSDALMRNADTVVGSGSADQASLRPVEPVCAQVDGVGEDERVEFSAFELRHEHAGLLLPPMCACYLTAALCNQSGGSSSEPHRGVLSLFEQALPPCARAFVRLCWFRRPVSCFVRISETSVGSSSLSCWSPALRVIASSASVLSI